MTLYRNLLFLCGLWAGSAQAQQSRELFGAYTLLSQTSIRLPSMMMNFGFVDPLVENFGLRFEYGFGQAKVVRPAHRISLALHSLMLGGQATLFENMQVWSGLTLSYAHGDLSIPNVAGATRRFAFQIIEASTQMGIGHRWHLGQGYYWGVDWLILEFPFQSQRHIDDRDSILQIKGPYFDIEQEIRDERHRMTEIRSLSVRLSLDL